MTRAAPEFLVYPELFYVSRNAVDAAVVVVVVAGRGLRTRSAGWQTLRFGRVLTRLESVLDISCARWTFRTCKCSLSSETFRHGSDQLEG